MGIKSINWTYIDTIANLSPMDSQIQSKDLETPVQPSRHECECPEPCNCDHENE